MYFAKLNKMVGGTKLIITAKADDFDIESFEFDNLVLEFKDESGCYVQVTYDRNLFDDIENDVLMFFYEEYLENKERAAVSEIDSYNRNRT